MMGTIRRALVPALAMFVVGAGAALYVVLFPTPAGQVVLPAPPEAIAVAAVAPMPAFEVREVAGVVEAGRGGAWRRLAVGARLYAGESLRSGDDGSAVLISPGSDELVLRERVTLEVTLLSLTLTELTLLRGKLGAAIGASTERLAVSAGSARAIAPSGARFTVYADARGAAFVATGEGAVQVLAGGQAVTVGAGAQTRVEPGEKPRDPYPIPDQVFLAVSWPAREQRQSEAVVRGITRPGTRIDVNGTPLIVGADGRFATPVTLREGHNDLEVHAEDLAGRQKTVHGSVRARTIGPPLEADPSRLYDPPEAR